MARIPLVVAALVAALATAPPAFGAASQETLPAPDPLTPRLFPPESQRTPPPGFRISAVQAIRIGERTQAVREARAEHPRLEPTAYISPLGLPQGTFYHWDVIWQAAGEEIVEVEISPSGQVLLTTEAPDVGWPLLLGRAGVLGGKLNAPYVWLPLCLLFLLPFLDRRRPLRLLHLDLLMLLLFGISHYFFNRGDPDLSVPLVYPFLGYAVARGLWAGFRPAARAGPLVPWLSTRALTVGVVALLAARIAFGITGSGTFDISAAGVIGADRIAHGLPLYVDNDAHGDTYGPVNYLMYVPMELALPSTPDDVGDAARAATLTFDLLMVAGLFLLGRSLRPAPGGNRLGAALAWAWAAFPYSALVIAANTNDALVPLFLVYALLLLRSPPARGLLAGVATMAKFVPVVVAPLLAAGRGPLRARPALAVSAAWALVCGGLIAGFLPDGGLRELWDTTVGFQLDRESPLSIWTRHSALDPLKPVVTAAVVALSLAVAFVPRRRSVGQVAALAAALLAAAQLTSAYWLYFYVVWFAPFLFVALFEEHADLGPVRRAASAPS